MPEPISPQPTTPTVRMFTEPQCKTNPHGGWSSRSKPPLPLRVSSGELSTGESALGAARGGGMSADQTPSAIGEGGRLNWKAGAVALAGLVLTFTAPPH